jgi:hypothetical protein
MMPRCISQVTTAVVSGARSFARSTGIGIPPVVGVRP